MCEGKRGTHGLNTFSVFEEFERKSKGDFTRPKIINLLAIWIYYLRWECYFGLLKSVTN